MNKRFFLAALTAVALSLGFTACSDDDDLTGNYELKGCLNIADSETQTDAEEYKHILDVYSKVLDISNEEGDFTIKGKDSLDCVSNITECCKQAEDQLKGATWTGVYNAQVLVNDYKTIVYNQQYGKYADNLVVERFRFRKKGDYNVPENTFVTGFSIQNNHYTPWESSDWPKKKWFCDYTVNTNNANRLYLCMQIASYKLDEVKKMVQNDDSRLNQLVGDVIVLYRDDNRYPKEFTYKGAKYEVCGGGTEGEKDPIDMNLKSGGPYMYLYVSHDVKHFNRVLDGYGAAIYKALENIFFKDTWGGVRDETSELVTGVYQDKNGNLTDHYEEGIDLYKGTGVTEFAKLRLSYVPLDELKGE